MFPGSHDKGVSDLLGYLFFCRRISYCSAWILAGLSLNEASYKALSCCPIRLSYSITEEIAWKRAKGNCRLSCLHNILHSCILFPWFLSSFSHFLFQSRHHSMPLLKSEPSSRRSCSLTVRNVPAIARRVFSCYLPQWRSGSKAVDALVNSLIIIDECRRAARPCWERRARNIYISKNPHKYINNI